MMKLEEAVAGRWIEHNESKARRFIAGVKLNGDIIIELKSGGTSTLSVDWFKDWTLLPPECDSFDWQPETFPQYYEPFEKPGVAFIKRVSKDTCFAVLPDGYECKRRDWDALDITRKQITEAEAIALLDKPEPVNPATRKVVLTEWLVQYRGSEEAFVVVRTSRPTLGMNCHAIGTREIEVPL